MVTSGGGWPLTIIMTPDKKPFFAGTYFPKRNRFGRSGLMEIIPQIKNYWINKREEILKSAEEISFALTKATIAKSGNDLTIEILDKAFTDFKNRFDSKFGGFGHAPKFPTPHNLLLLLRCWKRTSNNEALEMVTKTLTEMRKGGIYDHIGYGFHRYSTDEQWLVPHFEKMLYDQALLIMAYAEEYQVTKNELFKRTAEEIIEYVLRDLTSPEGGFFSAEDADSEGEEGKFYLWDENELESILGTDFLVVKKIFNTDKGGNWVDPMLGGAPGTNILHLQKSLEEISAETGIPAEELRNKIESARKKLFEVREKRIHPYKDDKILTDWNGLMISALSKAAQVFNEKKYSEAAEKAVTFIQNNLFPQNLKLLHRFREGDAGLSAHIDDYAFLTAGLLDLYEATFKVKYMNLALLLQQIQVDNYWDNEKGGFFFTSKDGEKLLIRQKEIYDGAIPSGNSISLLNLLRLGRITGNTEFEEKADKLIKAFSVQISSSPMAFAQFLNGTDFALGPTKEIVVVGKDGSPETQKMLNLIRKKFIPGKILLFKDIDNPEISEIAEFTKGQNIIDGKTTVYICENYNCKMPVIYLESLDELLK
jgi:hypothetical protein